MSIFVSFKYRCCDLQQSDRFITDRSDMDFNDANYMLAGVEENAVENGNVHSPSKVRSEVLLFTLSSLQLDSTWKGLQSPPEIPPHPLYSLEILSGKLGQNSYSVMMYRNFALVIQKEYKKQLAENLLCIDNNQRQPNSRIQEQASFATLKALKMVSNSCIPRTQRLIMPISELNFGTFLKQLKGHSTLQTFLTTIT